MKDKRINVLKKTGFFLLACLLLPCLLLLAMEGIARLLAPDDMVLRTPYLHKLHDHRSGQFPYVNRAGYRGQIVQHTVSINSLHLRSPDLGAYKHLGQRVRLLLLGDGVMFGTGLSDDEAPTALLETYLGRPYQVLNGSSPGYSTHHTLAFLNEFGDRLRPDAVILGYCLNDPIPGNRETRIRVQNAQQRVNWFAQVNSWLRGRSMLYMQLKSLFGVYRLRHGYMDAYRPLYNEASWAANRKAIVEIVRWCRDRQIPFYLAVFPHRDQLIEEVPTDDHPQHLLAGLSQEVGFGFLDLRSVLAPEDFLPNDALHLDPRGMQKAMQAIAQRLQQDTSARR